MSARKKDEPGQGSSDSVSEAAQRLAVIVEAAEQAASSVIDNAEEQARLKLEEAQARADRIVAERLRLHADELDPPGAGQERPRLRPVQSDVEASVEEPIATREPGEAGARLLATQMAVSGASREEIEERLRNGCGIEDPSALLEAILGPED